MEDQDYRLLKFFCSHPEGIPDNQYRKMFADEESVYGYTEDSFNKACRRIVAADFTKTDYNTLESRYYILPTEKGISAFNTEKERREKTEKANRYDFRQKKYWWIPIGISVLGGLYTAYVDYAGKQSENEYKTRIEELEKKLSQTNTRTSHDADSLWKTVQSIKTVEIPHTSSDTTHIPKKK